MLTSSPYVQNEDQQQKRNCARAMIFQLLSSNTRPEKLLCDWIWKQYQEENPIFQDAGQFISNKAEQFIGKNKLIRINVNGQTLNQQGSAHIDYPHRDHYTFVYFSNTKWDKRWDGSFRVFTDLANYSFDYQSNSGVLVHADWPHYGQAPNINTDALRTTIAWSYCELH